MAIPFEPYKLSRKQYGTRKAHMKSNLMFTVNGRCGAPLVQSDPLEQLDGRLDRMFEGYGTKVAYVMQVSTHQHCLQYSAKSGYDIDKGFVSFPDTMYSSGRNMPFKKSTVKRLASIEKKFCSRFLKS